MYTCDICGIDQLDRENLIAVDDLEFPADSGRKVYDCSDLLVCSGCLEKYSLELKIVEGC